MIRLGLERVRRALARLGHPEEDFAAVIVAGTNGKGSVSALVAAAARAAGLKTGHYTSPHLVDLRERVRVDGRMIPAADWARLARRVSSAGGALTEFERQTVLAFLWFAQSRVDLAVLEVGLGGRLDAVNAHPAPEAAVITSIGHDHQAWLGRTLDKIYVEKRGVARAGTILVQDAPRALWPLGDADARARGFPLWTLGREVRAAVRAADWRGRRQTVDVDLPGARFAGLRVPLMGAHQARNAALAAALCLALRRRGWPLTEEAVRRGFAAAAWPGRFQVFPGRPDVIVDGAHNQEAAEALAAAYRASPWGKKKTTVVFGCLKDKDAGAIARALRPLARRAVVAPLPTDRSRAARDLKPLWRGVEVIEAPDAAAAVRAARGFAEPVLVTGSLYLAGEAMKTLGKVPT